MGGGAGKQSWQRKFFLTNNGPDNLPPGEPYLEVYPVWSLAVTKNGKQLAAATSDNKINLWCLTTFNLLIALTGHAETVWQLAYSPDDSLLASCSADGNVKFWEANSGRCALTQPHRANWVWSLAWSPDGERLATGGSDGRIMVWNVHDAVEAARKADFFNQQATMDPAMLQTAALEADQAAKKNVPLILWQAHEKSIHKLCFAPTESRMLISVGAEGTVAVWDAEVGALDSRLCGHLGAVTCADVNPAISEVIATGGEDHTVRLWDLRDLEPGTSAAKISREKAIGLNLAHYTLKGHEGGVVQVKFMTDGRLLASASKDCEVRIWIPDLGNPVLLKRFLAHEAWIRDLSWAHDQKLIFTCSTDGMVYAWDVPRKYHFKGMVLNKKGNKRYIA